MLGASLPGGKSGSVQSCPVPEAMGTHRRLQLNIRRTFFTGRVMSEIFPAESCISLGEYSSCETRGCGDFWGHHAAPGLFSRCIDTSKYFCKIETLLTEN